MSDGTGLENVPASVGIPPAAVSAKTSSATTMATPADEIPARQGVGAVAHVENLAIQLPPGSGSTTLGIRAANSQATAVCVERTPVLDGTSEALGATLGGQEIPIEQAGQQLAQALAPLGDAVDLKLDEQIRTATGLTVNALHLKVLSAAGTPVVDLVAGQSHVGYSGDICNPAGQTPVGAGNGSGNGANSANSAGSRTLLANGIHGSTCGRLRMYFAANHKTKLTNRIGTRRVVRGKIVNCQGKGIVRARIDVIHVLKHGKRKLVKTGLRSRAGGALTLILPMNLKTRDLRFEYRGNLLSTKVTSRSTLHMLVKNRHGKVLR